MTETKTILPISIQENIIAHAHSAVFIHGINRSGIHTRETLIFRPVLTLKHTCCYHMLYIWKFRLSDVSLYFKMNALHT